MTDQGSTNFLFIPYSYSAISGVILHGASQTVPLLLDQDADFELHEIVVGTNSDALTDAAAAAIRPNYCALQIADKTNGRLWSDGLVPQAIYSRVPGGFKLYRPVLLARRSNLAVTFTNITAATDTLICALYLLGAKVLQYGAR